MSDYGVILFHTSSEVFRAEKVLKQAGLPCKLIPTPREFSSDCGMAIRFEWKALSSINTLFEKSKIETAGVHQFNQ